MICVGGELKESVGCCRVCRSVLTAGFVCTSAWQDEQWWVPVWDWEMGAPGYSFTVDLWPPSQLPKEAIRAGGGNLPCLLDFPLDHDGCVPILPRGAQCNQLIFSTSPLNWRSTVFVFTFIPCSCNRQPWVEIPLLSPVNVVCLLQQSIVQEQLY